MRPRHLLVTLLLLASGCASSESLERVYVLSYDEDREGTYLGMPLESGQIVLSEAGSPFSLLFSLATERYFDFTHAGVLVMENGEPWIYEMTGEYKPGIDDRPTDGIEGACRKVPLMTYGKAYLYLEVFDPPEGVDKQAVADWAKAQLAKGIEFDPYFQWRDKERLFCTQFVQMAMEAGGAPEIELEVVRQHKSIQQLFEWLQGAQDMGLPAGALGDPKRSVASMGQLPSLKAVRGYFLAKREIHRRFTEDQRLGNLFSLDGPEIHLRPELLRFLERSMNAIHDAPRMSPADEWRTIQALAVEMFGVAPPAKENS